MKTVLYGRMGEEMMGVEFYIKVLASLEKVRLQF